MAKSLLEKVRRICLELPEAHEVEAWGAPTFRVKNKLFVMYASPDNHHGSGRHGIWVKSTAVNQDLLIQSDKDRFFFPPYVGPSGWVGIYLDNGPDWSAMESLIRDGYALTAPKKILALLGAGPTPKTLLEPVRKTGRKTGRKKAKKTARKVVRKNVKKAAQKRGR